MKTAKEIRHIIYLAATVIGMLVFLPVLFSILRSRGDATVVRLEDGWYMERGETNMEEVSLSRVVTSPMLAGETVLLTHPLPDETVPDACIEVTTEYAFLRVFADGVQIYNYGDPEEGSMVPLENHTIRLPDGYEGTELLLAFTAAQRRAFGTIQPVYFGSRDDLFLRRMQSGFYACMYGIFFVCYGVMLLIQSVFLARYVKKNLRLLSAALITLPCGLYLLSANGFFTYVFYDSLINSEIGLSALFLVPAAVSGMFASLRRGAVRKLFLALTVFNVLWVILMYILYSSPDRFYPLSYHLWSFRGLVIAETLAGAALLAFDYYRTGKTGGEFFVRRDARRRPMPEIVLFTGSCVLVLSVFVDIVLFRAFYGQRAGGFFGSGITLSVAGVLCFQACIILNHFFFAAEHLGEISRNRKLNEIAYTDPLTGHSNRAHCDLVMRELDESGVDFCMINMDVNGLKIINDTLGHAEGDRFLKGFAQILKIFFKNADLIGRMGGDEFLVILKNTGLTEARDRMEALTVLLHKMNKSESSFKYEASYGVADSREIVIGKKSTEVYRLADERMYEMKREVHARRGGNGRD